MQHMYPHIHASNTCNRINSVCWVTYIEKLKNYPFSGGRGPRQGRSSLHMGYTTTKLNVLQQIYLHSSMLIRLSGTGSRRQGGVS
eukprot:1094006-Amorphochlora_amoeboformis.AAC.1